MSLVTDLIFVVTDLVRALADREENILGMNFHECNLLKKSKPN